MVMACGHASDGQERDLRQGPMTARKAEPDGCLRVLTVGYVQKLGTQGHPQLEPKGDYHGQGFNQKLGQTRNELSGALNCGRNRHRNVSKPRKHFTFKTGVTRKCMQSPVSVNGCPLIPAPFQAHTSIRRSFNTEAMASDTLVEFRLWSFLL